MSEDDEAEFEQTVQQWQREGTAKWVNVYNADDYCVSTGGVVVSFLFNPPRILKPIQMGSYVGLQLKCNDGNRRHRYVHRIVLESFIGSCPKGMECRHLDGNRLNNRLDNLQWGTKSENVKDKDRHGTSSRGMRNPMAVLSICDVERIRDIRSIGGFSYSDIATYFGVSVMTAYRASTKQSWTHI